MKSAITDKELIKLTGKLKEQFKNWAVLMAEEISETKEWKAYSNNPMSVENLRKISDGTIKGDAHRRAFVVASARLFLKCAQQGEEDRKLIESIK